MRRSYRIAVLLAVLALVAGVTTFERLWVRGGSHPLEVVIYPAAVTAGAAAYADQVSVQDFQEISDYIAAQAQRWSHKSSPAPHITLRPRLHELPPMDSVHSRLDAVSLSLRLRWFAFRQTPFWDSVGKIRLFVLYHELRYDQALPHSLGLRKGLMGIAHVFASDQQRAQNNVVIAHELLHTLGATDKYRPDGQPLYPAGFADPEAQPRFPQDQAEIMAGRIPLSETHSEIPRSLHDTLVGYVTASEVGW
jgi:hypothetical protein